MAHRFLTKETLKEAVDLWCKNRDEARERYGHIRNWDVSSVKNMRELFNDKKKFNDNISRWDVSNVTDMSGMFHGARAFNRDIGDWDVSNVTNMSGMFNAARSFNQAIGDWDVSNVTDMTNMFEGAFAFNESIGDWDVINVTSMRFMFMGAESFNQPIGLWDVSNVTDMINMFGEAYLFNQPIGDWNVSNVTGMSYMFRNAHKFNQPIGDWNVSNVTNMNYMFGNAFKFNQPIGRWNVSNVTMMENMFENAIVFNQDIRNWNMSNVTRMKNMFNAAVAMQPENQPPAPAPPQTVRPLQRYRYSPTDGTLHALPHQPEPLPQPQSRPRPQPESPATIVYNNIAATPLEESSAIFDTDATAVDIIDTGEEFNLKTYLDANVRNVAFKLGNAYYICTKDDIQNNCINSDSNIIFGCKKVDTSIVPRAENVIRDIPYINPRCFGILVGLFRLSDIKTVLNDPTIRCIEVGDYPTDEKGVRALNPRPVTELVTVTSLSMLGQNPNALGALHCQDGQKMQVYSLRKMAFPPAAEMGGSKQTRRINRHSKRKHSKNQKQTKKRGARKTRK